MDSGTKGVSDGILEPVGPARGAWMRAGSGDPLPAPEGGAEAAEVGQRKSRAASRNGDAYGSG